MLVIFIGLVAGGNSPAAESLLLQGETPKITFDDIVGTFQTWDVFGDDLGFDIVDFTATTTPFHISPGAPDHAFYMAGDGAIGIGTDTPDGNSWVDVRSSTFANGLIAVRGDAGPHFLRVETPAGVFRSGVQGNGDAQFGALTAGKGLNLLAGGSTKLLMNSTGQITFGNTPTAITTHALLHSSGAHLTFAGVWTNASSRALKQDIEPITSEQARDTVRALQPVGYRYKSELNERYVGFIAEDVPELVATNDRKGLAPMDITAVLTKVVQDQDRQLEGQSRLLQGQGKQLAEERQRNDRLERSVESLLKRLTDLEQQRNRDSAAVK